MKISSIVRNVLAAFGVIFIGLLIYAKIAGPVPGWNKEQGMDVVQEFNRAYIMQFDNTTKVVNIKSWRDYEYSDQIQVTTTSGVTYLTHASRLILVNDKSIDEGNNQ